MFLRPQHFQAADRHHREAIRLSEDWYRPFNWGLRSLSLDRDAVSNYALVVRSGEARFKDGTKLTIPDDATADPVELKAALEKSGEVMAYLAVPALKPGRANVEERPTADGPRFWIDEQELDDENTGGGEQMLQVRRTRCRVLLSTQDHTGYEILPLARIIRSAQAEAPPQIDAGYVPPLLAIDAWPNLWRRVQSLHYQIGGRIEALSTYLIDRDISFESQVPGDAMRILMLSTLNEAFSHLESIAYLRGLAPLHIYEELCRLVGRLALFTPARRPPNVPPYDHEDLGGCFETVIRYIQLGLDPIIPTAFQKRYFERTGERLQVSMEPAWLTNAHSLFLGVETELSDQECQSLLDSMDMKMGSGAQVEHYFQQRTKGLALTPVSRPPRALPAGKGTVYYSIERDKVFWDDVTETHTLGVRMNLTRATFRDDKTLELPTSRGGRAVTLRFALYVI